MGTTQAVTAAAAGVGDSSSSSSNIADILGKTTYAKISEDTGIARQHISYVFRGERNPSLELSSRLAQVLGVSLDELHRYLESVRNGEREVPLTGGYPREYRAGGAKGFRSLTEEEAEVIRGDLKTGKSYREIARDRGVSRQTVGNIARGLHY